MQYKVTKANKKLKDMKKVISPEDSILTKKVLQYLEFSPVLHCRLLNTDGEYIDKELRIYADKKMRKSIINNLLQGKLIMDLVGSNVILKQASKPVAIKMGVRGDDTPPIMVTMIELDAQKINSYAQQPQGVQRTAKEQADYLFGQLISQVGGEEWIKEQTWIARGQDIIHNNNKGNVAYTRLDIMLNRCLRIYNQFNQDNAQSETAE